MTTQLPLPKERVSDQQTSDLISEQEPVGFDALRDAVAEMTGVSPMEWRTGVYKGHQPVPFINFNSLGRIVDKFRVVAPPVTAHKQEAVGIVRYVDVGLERQGVHVTLYDAALPEGTELFTHAAPSMPAMVPDAGVTAEHQRVIRMLLDVCGAAFELADDSCQQEVDGESCHVVPEAPFAKLSNALDEIENTLPDEYEDLPNTVLQWAAIPRHALRSALQTEPQSALPNIPAGYVLVPLEPTENMVIEGFESEPNESFSDSDEWEAYQAMSGCEQAAHRAKLCWAAMLAAAPAKVVTGE